MPDGCFLEKPAVVVGGGSVVGKMIALVMTAENLSTRKIVG
jgi:5,10-methylene-tetrahydrofolate dehydrogenase/methenyl tetrahydrofolate cyclohydrolase